MMLNSDADVTVYPRKVCAMLRDSEAMFIIENPMQVLTIAEPNSATKPFVYV
jgi:hypothetical protein